VSFLVKLFFVEFAAQGAFTDAEETGGLSAVKIGSFQGGVNEQLFGLSQG